MLTDAPFSETVDGKAIVGTQVPMIIESDVMNEITFFDNMAVLLLECKGIHLWMPKVTLLGILYHK